MQFTPVNDPVQNETTAAVEPTPAPQVDATWRRERFTTGRSVSAPALIHEQDHRSGRLSLLGQGLRPGVILGLEAELEGGGGRVRVAPGMGLAGDGQDLTLPAPMHVQPTKLPTRRSAALDLPALDTAGPEPALSEVLAARQRIAAGGVAAALPADVLAVIPRRMVTSLVDAVLRAESGLKKTLSRASFSTISMSEAASRLSVTRAESARLSAADGLVNAEVSLDAARPARTVDLSASISTNVAAAYAEATSLVEASAESLLAALPAEADGGRVRAEILQAYTRYRLATSPQVCALVLEPVEVEAVAGQGLSTDPCERDLEAEPFEDKRRVDATRAVWIPVESLFATAAQAADFLAACFTTGDDAMDRNRLAWGLFNLEDALDGEPMPWARGGVPVALACFTAQGGVLWLDRAAVVRRGGLETDRSDLLGSGGGPTLWQARIEQFNEQLAGMPLTRATALADHFRFLPPAGVLPAELLSTHDRLSPLFPESWGVSAAPVPLDQLDAVLRGSAPLAPFDLASGDGDELRLLVPVRREVWEPGLLRIEAVAPDFLRSLDAARARRDAWLRRRAELRARLSTLRVSVGGVEAALRFELDVGDEAAERVASEVLWNNPAAMALIERLGAQEGGPLLATREALDEAGEALLSVALDPDTLGATPEATTLSRVSPDADAAVPFTPDASGLGGLLGELLHLADPAEAARAVVRGEGGHAFIQGPSRRYDGGWTHPVMADDEGLAVLRDATLVIVPGTLDPDALERAEDDAQGGPLLILCSAVDALATERVVWRQHRGLSVPVVVQVQGEDVEATLRADRDALGLAKRRNLDEYSRAGAVSLAVVDARAATLVNVAGASTPAGAALVIPDDDLDSHVKLRYAMQLIARLSEVEDAATVDGESLLRLLGGGSGYGTRPGEAGLTPVLLDELIDRVDGLRAPQPGGDNNPATLSESQLADPDVAHDRPRVFAAGATSVVGELGLDGFVALHAEQVRRADALVDFSFLQVQTATYRVREDMLGRDKAVRMASSPVLAELSDLVRADDSPQQLASFFEAVRAETSAPDGGGTSGGGGGTSGGGTSGGGTSGGSTPYWYNDLFNKSGTRDSVLLSGSSDAVSVFRDDLDAVKFRDAPVESALPVPPSDDPVKNIAFESNVVYTAPTYTAPTYTAPTYSGFTINKVFGRGLSGSAEGESHAGSAEGRAHALSATPRSATLYRSLSAPVYKRPLAVEPETVSVTRSVTVERMVEIARHVRATTPVGFSLRNTGIFERVQRSRAVAARQSAFRLRATLSQSLADLELNLLGVRFPGFVYSALPADVKAKIDVPLDAQGQADPASSALVYAPLTTTVLRQVLGGTHDIVSGDEDAGALYSDAVRSLEVSSAMLHIVEGHIGLVNEILLDARRTRALLLRLAAAVERELDRLEDELAEARHDVAVIEALLTEERERVEAVNARRARVLADEVPFLLYHRPRMAEALDALPTHDLEPAFDERQALRAALQPAPAAPEELRDMVELVRELPAAAFPALKKALADLNRLEALRRTLELARQRALAAQRAAPPAPARALSGLRGRSLVQALVAQRHRRAVTARAPAAELSAARVSSLAFKQAAAEAERVVSVGDLLDSRWSSAAASRQAAGELEALYRVAAHFYAELCLVSPELRGTWATRLSEHDDPVDLRDLSTLPRWSEVGQGSGAGAVDPFRRRELQAMASWLHGRVRGQDGEALSFMNDLLRVCILLASHAPVGRILAGQVDEPTPVHVGALVPVRVDPARLRVGMVALLTVRGGVKARAVVEDLGQDRVVARVVTTSATDLVLDRGAPVRFMEADGLRFPGAPEQADGPTSAVGPRLLR